MSRNRVVWIVVLICALTALCSAVRLPSAQAAAGDLDRTFNRTGYLTKDFHATFNATGGTVVQPDGKIVVVGSLTVNGSDRFLVVRYESDGTLDTSFGKGGWVTTDFGETAAASAVVLQPDGKLVVVGWASTYKYFALVRYERNGSLDPTFGQGGTVVTTFGDPQAFASAVALQADGKIVAAGSSGFPGVAYQFALARFLPDGTVDPTFGAGGQVTTNLTGRSDSATAVVVQLDGSVIAGGYAGGIFGEGFALVRYLPNGALDPLFGSGGHVITSFGPYGGEIAALALQLDGRLLAVGSVATGADIQTGPTRIFALARYLPTGTSDPTFGTGGKVTTWINNYDQRANAVALRPGGGFVVAGSATGPRGFVLAGYDLNGRLDGSFGDSGIVATDTGFGAPAVGGLATQPDGKIVVAGSALIAGRRVLAVARYRLPPLPVADPATSTTTPPVTTVPVPTGGDINQKASVPSPRSGYWTVTADGVVHAFGDAKNHGDPHAALGGARAAHLAPTPTGNGYWILDTQGRVHPFGDAIKLGDVVTNTPANDEQSASLSATPSGRGHWVFSNRGRVLAFGDAAFLGDMSTVKLNGPVLGSVATPSGKGYYMVASDGGIFAFGDAAFAGSMGGKRLNAPVQSLVPDSDGKGYWLVASDGGIFAFDAPFRGSMGGTKLNRPVVGMVRYGDGYLMVGADGGIFNFSTAPFAGSLGDRPPASAVVAVAALP